MRFTLQLVDRLPEFLELQQSLGTDQSSDPPQPSTTDVEREHRDVFVCHASEDKEEIARPLAEGLRAAGLSVWFDEFELTLGDRLRRTIERGLSISRFGAVILSDSFFKKDWPQAELDALFALERESTKILPVWHGLDSDDIRRLAPLLADRLAISTSEGLQAVIDAVVKATTLRR